MNLCFCEDVEKGSVLSFFRWERFSSLCFSQRIYFSFCFFNVIAVIFNIISYLAIVLNLLRLFIWRDSVSLYDLPQTSDFNKTNSIRLIEFVVSSSYISSYTKLIWKLHRLVYFYRIGRCSVYKTLQFFNRSFYSVYSDKWSVHSMNCTVFVPYIEQKKSLHSSQYTHFSWHNKNFV